MRFVRSSVLVIAALTSSATFAQMREYVLEQVPSALGNCHELARTLGQKFAQLTGFEQTRGYCADISSEGYELRFQYPAAEELPLVSTIDRLGGPSGQGAIFATRQECESVLPSEKGRFERATGLSAFVAYCFRDEDSDRPFAIRVDSFGNPAVTPHVTWTLANAKPLTITPAQLEANLAIRLREIGIDASYVKYNSVGESGILMFLYYRSAPVPLRVINVVRTLTRESCGEALAGLSHLSERSRSGLGLAYCATKPSNGTFELIVINLRRDTLRVVTSAERFSSEADCMRDRSQLVDEYDRREGAAAEFAACTVEPRQRQWRVVMLY